MKRWMKWLVSPAVLGTIGLIVLSALVWWVGPLLAIGSWRPLDAILWRALLVGLIWLAWISSYVWRAWLPQFRAPDALRDTVKQDCAIIAKINSHPRSRNPRAARLTHAGLSTTARLSSLAI